MALVCVGMLLCASCGNKNEDAKEAPPHSVLTQRVSGAQMSSEKSLSGVVTERAELGIGFKTAGQILQVNVREGQYIKAGQLLATLDSKDYKLQLDATQIQYDQTAREVERLRKLYEGKAATGSDLDKAESGLKQLAVQLQSYKNQLSYTRLTSPASGYVQKVNFHRGEMVNAGTPVFTVLSAGQAQVEVNIPMAIYQHRNRIRAIRCTAAGRTYNMHLSSVTPKADNNQLMKALLSFSGATGKEITPGLSVTVDFLMTEDGAIGSFSLPLGALFEDSGRHCVWVVNNDSTVSAREVAIGAVDASGQVTIKGGLNGSETVVKAGADALHDGEKVKIVEKASATNVGALL